MYGRSASESAISVDQSGKSIILGGGLPNGTPRRMPRGGRRVARRAWGTSSTAVRGPALKVGLGDRGDRAGVWQLAQHPVGVGRRCPRTRGPCTPAATVIRSAAHAYVPDHLFPARRTAYVASWARLSGPVLASSRSTSASCRWGRGEFGRSPRPPATPAAGTVLANPGGSPRQSGPVIPH